MRNQKKKMVKEREVICPVCKVVKKSFWDPSRCNHNQEEEGEPLPLGICTDLDKYNDAQVEAIKEKRGQG